MINNRISKSLSLGRGHHNENNQNHNHNHNHNNMRISNNHKSKSSMGMVPASVQSMISDLKRTTHPKTSRSHPRSVIGVLSTKSGNVTLSSRCRSNTNTHNQSILEKRSKRMERRSKDKRVQPKNSAFSSKKEHVSHQTYENEKVTSAAAVDDRQSYESSLGIQYSGRQTSHDDPQDNHCQSSNVVETKQEFINYNENIGDISNSPHFHNNNNYNNYNNNTDCYDTPNSSSLDPTKEDVSSSASNPPKIKIDSPHVTIRRRSSGISCLYDWDDNTVYENPPKYCQHQTRNSNDTTASQANFSEQEQQHPHPHSHSYSQSHSHLHSNQDGSFQNVGSIQKPNRITSQSSRKTLSWMNDRSSQEERKEKLRKEVEYKLQLKEQMDDEKKRRRDPLQTDVHNRRTEKKKNVVSLK